MLVGLILGIALGAVGTGVIAHRKPEWFNKAVMLVNKLDDQVNAKVDDLKK